MHVKKPSGGLLRAILLQQNQDLIALQNALNHQQRGSIFSMLNVGMYLSSSNHRIDKKMLQGASRSKNDLLSITAHRITQSW